MNNWFECTGELPETTQACAQRWQLQTGSEVILSRLFPVCEHVWFKFTAYSTFDALFLFFYCRPVGGEQNL